MQGHITKRSKDSWSVVIELGRDPLTGKRRQMWATVRGTKREAERELVKRLAERDQGMSVPSAKTTVGEYLTSWLATYAEGAVAPTTYRRYEQLLRVHVVPVIGAIPLQRLEPLHVQGVYTVMAEKRLAARTVVQAHRVLREALQHALRWQLIGRNAADSVELPRPDRYRPMTVEPEQLRSVLAAADETAYGTFFFLAAATGLRQSELCGLSWESVDLERSTLTVEQSCHWLPRQGFIFRQPKTTTSIRAVTLSAGTGRRLREHRHEQLQERLSAGAAYDQEAKHLVFGDAIGRPLHPSNIRTAWQAITKQADVAGLRVHDLRHAHASALLRQGVHVKVISERLGHASIAVTMDLYGHLTGNLQEDAAEAFDRALADG